MTVNRRILPFLPAILVLALPFLAGCGKRDDGPAIPHLLDFGSGHCIPCKMMEPILEDLTEEFAGRLRVTFIDVEESPERAKQYGIELIPTQIFLSPKEKELFRHVGFMAKADILAKWRELGYDFAE